VAIELPSLTAHKSKSPLTFVGTLTLSPVDLVEALTVAGEVVLKVGTQPVVSDKEPTDAPSTFIG
jgi:hypothetical protein